MAREKESWIFYFFLLFWLQEFQFNNKMRIFELVFFYKFALVNCCVFICVSVFVYCVHGTKTFSNVPNGKYKGRRWGLDMGKFNNKQRELKNESFYITVMYGEREKEIENEK